MSGAELEAVRALNEVGLAALVTLGACGGIGLTIVLADLLKLRRARRQRRSFRDGLTRRRR